MEITAQLPFVSLSEWDITPSDFVTIGLLVVLEARGVKLTEVEEALAKRTSQSGLEEKASRKRD